MRKDFDLYLSLLLIKAKTNNETRQAEVKFIEVWAHSKSSSLK